MDDNSRDYGDMQQKRDILKEMAAINQQAQDPKAYRKTISWHQQYSDGQALSQTGQIEQVIQCLNRIEEKLDGIANMLKP